MPEWNWNGRPGHYEVFYLTTTDPQTGTGLWIRHTMLAPGGGAKRRGRLAPPGAPSESSWFIATFPDAPPIARKLTAPKLDAECTPTGMHGAIDDVAWDLRWTRPHPPRLYQHVHPLLRRGIAKTILELPNADIAVHGTVTLPGGRELALDGAHGGQAHLWGSKHALRWAWAHCGDFEDAPGTFVDGVSVFVPRLRREIGPSTPVVGRILGEDFAATSPLRVIRAPSRFALTSWSFEVRDGRRRLAGEVDAPRASLAGVTYADPDGEQAYCYNSEVASMRLSVFDDGRLTRTLVSHGRAHFEYAQRTPVPGLELHLT